MIYIIPQNPKANRLEVQPAKRSLYGIPSLAVANHLAPTKKIKIKITSEELDLCKFCLLLEYIRKNVGAHAVA
jgi:hypothetical protein